MKPLLAQIILYTEDRAMSASVIRQNEMMTCYALCVLIVLGEGDKHADHRTGSAHCARAASSHANAAPLRVKGGDPAKGRRGSAAFPIPDHLLHRGTPRLRANSGP